MNFIHFDDTIPWIRKNRLPFRQTRGHPMQLQRTCATLFAVALLATGAARAQDVNAGREIAQRWCSNCHLVDSRQPNSANDVAPSFQSIAQVNSTTQSSLTSFLSTPHWRMPDFTLSRNEIRDVSAYILSLRKSP